QRERGEDADLDRRIDLCARRHLAKAAGAGSQSLSDSTDSKCHPFRENAHFASTSNIRHRRKFAAGRQPTDSVQSLTGQQCFPRYASTSSILALAILSLDR